MQPISITLGLMNRGKLNYNVLLKAFCLLYYIIGNIIPNSHISELV